MNESDRFDLAVKQIVSKRLTCAEVTGNVNIPAVNSVGRLRRSGPLAPSASASVPASPGRF